MNAHTAKMPGATAGLLLGGVDGSNTLAFLSALGVLQVLGETVAGADVRMHWTASGAAWVPVISGRGVPASEADLLDTLERVSKHNVKLPASAWRMLQSGSAAACAVESVSASTSASMSYASTAPSQFISPTNADRSRFPSASHSYRRTAFGPLAG